MSMDCSSVVSIIYTDTNRSKYMYIYIYMCHIMGSHKSGPEAVANAFCKSVPIIGFV